MKKIKMALWVLAIFCAILLVFILSNLAVNWALGVHAPFGWVVNGRLSDWHNYLGAMVSTSITSFVTFVILFITIKDNKDSRTQQHNIIQYQLYLQLVESYKVSIKDILETYKKENLRELQVLINKNLSSREDFANNLIKSANSTYNNVIIVFSRQLDDAETTFLSTFKEMHNRYISIIRDLQWIASTDFGENDQGNDWNKPLPGKILHQSSEYKNNSPEEEQNQQYRIWNIIPKYVTNQKIELDNFINDMTDKIIPEETCSTFYHTSLDFINYQNGKANNILNGTETK